MSLWRLPPIVIIHLKRFQFTQHMRRKLRDLVVFPIEGLDLSRIVASDNAVPPEEAAAAAEQLHEGGGAAGIQHALRGEQLGDIEIAGELEVGPVVQWVAEELRHRLVVLRREPPLLVIRICRRQMQEPSPMC